MIVDCRFAKESSLNFSNQQSLFINHQSVVRGTSATNRDLCILPVMLNFREIDQPTRSPRHSRAGGNPVARSPVIPAQAGIQSPPPRVIPAHAGIQPSPHSRVIPACAGMTMKPGKSSRPPLAARDSVPKEAATNKPGGLKQPLPGLPSPGFHPTIDQARRAGTK